MTFVNVTIRGDTPLLQHRFSETSEVHRATRNVIVQQRNPRDEADKAAHKTDDGRFFFPGAAIGRLIREAGGNHKIRGSRKSAKYVVPAAVLVMDDAVMITNGDGITPVDNFEVDARPVVIPATKGRIMRYRPRFDRWSASFTIRINDSVLPVEFVQQLLTEGGQQIGVGDFRPEKGGPFGVFQIVTWSRIG